MTRIVVLGTGTGVGKTHVSRALAEALARADPDAVVVALKPIETGIDPVAAAEAQTGSDAALLAAASRGAAGATLPRRALYTFADPVTPHLAAQRAGQPIDFGAVVAWTEAAEGTPSPRAWSVIESAGGVFSPVAGTATNYELAIALEPAIWVLVAADALGVLHDVSATLEALAARGRSPDFVVLSAARGRDASTGTNAAVLRELGIADPICVLDPGETRLEPLVTALTKRRASAAQD